jgi:CheY-like chemotaxis protein
VLVDLWMPVMDGREFLRRQKQDPQIAAVPVVVVSAVPPASVEGAETVLRKPVELGRLIETVKHYAQRIDAVHS